AFLALLSLLTFATGFSQKLVLSVRDATLSKIFRQIESQTDYVFLYDNQILKNTGLVTVDYRGGDVQTLLKEVLKDQSLTCSFKKKKIVIKRDRYGNVREESRGGVRTPVTPRSSLA